MQVKSILKDKPSEAGETSAKKSLYRNPLFHIVLVTIIGFLVYSNTFNVPFQFDDNPNIVENYKLKDLSNFWPPSGSRWFGFLTFALNYHFGGLNTFGYHIFNLLIHILNAILVYYLVVLTFKTHYFKVSVISASVSNQPNQFNLSTFKPLNYLPLFIALLFVSHPIQTQAVTYIVQRFTSLATFFYLLSFVMYIKFRIHDTRYTIQDKKSKNRESCIMHHASEPKLHATRYTLSPRTLLSKCGAYTVSLLSAILAMKTKEIAFTLPFIIALYEFMFFKGKINGALLGSASIKKRILYLIPLFLTMFIIPLSLIGIDKPIGDAIGELREAAQETEEISRWSYLFTQFRVVVTYIRLLSLPIDQNLDYDYPIYHSFFEPNVFLSFLFLLSTFVTTVYLFYRSRFTVDSSQSQNSELKTPNTQAEACGYTLPPQVDATRLISFGIFWFFITLSVESSIIPIRDVIFEHRVYLPSVGIIIAFSTATFYVLHRATEQQSNRAVVKGKTAVLLCYCSAALIVIILSIATYQRNIVWQDEITLWEDVVKKSPNKARGYNGVGYAYYNKGLVDEAIEHYQIAIRLNPLYADAHNNLGNAYKANGWTNKAIEHYRIALRINPDYVEAHNNLGNTYKAMGWVDKAIEHYQIALKLKPDFAEAHNNLGNVYRDKGWTDKAIEHYEIALRLNPDYPEAHNNLAVAYASKGLTDKAIEHYQIALRLKPDFADAHFNLGLIYLRTGIIEKALTEFEITLKINPRDYQAQQLLNYISNLNKIRSH